MNGRQEIEGAWAELTGMCAKALGALARRLLRSPGGGAMIAQYPPYAIRLVPEGRVAAFEEAGWSRWAKKFDRIHHGRWSAMMSRPWRADDTPESLMAETRRIEGARDQPHLAPGDQVASGVEP